MRASPSKARIGDKTRNNPLCGFLVGAMLWGMVLVVACDLPPREDKQENQWVISSSPKDGDRNVSRLSPISIQLDRRVLPYIEASNSVQLKSGDVNAFFRIIIEPVERKIHLELYSRYPLEPEITYRLGVDDLVDLDGQWQDKRFEAFFRTSRQIGSFSPLPRVTWTEVASVFSERCALAACHGAKTPALHLDLSSSTGVEQTARGVHSRQLQSDLVSAEGAQGALSLAGIPIIETQPGVGQAARSYLIYKVLADPHILGDAMPPPDSSLSPLSKSERKLLSYWIIGGAPTNND